VEQLRTYWLKTKTSEPESKSVPTPANESKVSPVNSDARGNSKMVAQQKKLIADLKAVTKEISASRELKKSSKAKVRAGD